MLPMRTARKNVCVGMADSDELWEGLIVGDACVEFAAIDVARDVEVEKEVDEMLNDAETLELETLKAVEDADAVTVAEVPLDGVEAAALIVIVEDVTREESRLLELVTAVYVVDELGNDSPGLVVVESLNIYREDVPNFELVELIALGVLESREGEMVVESPKELATS